MTDIELVKLKELALSASSGCWHQETEHECPWSVVDENGIQVAIMQQRTTIRDNPKQTDRAANAAFIAGANPAVILALIEQLEAAQRQRDEWKEHSDKIYEAFHAAEAELKRRDDVEAVATRGMPKYEIYTKQMLFDDGSSRETDMVELSVLQRQREITRQLAVESNRLSDEKRELVEELKRRDEQEPVHFYREHNLYNGMTTSWVEVEAKDIDALRELTNPETAEIRTFYAAAPAAPAAAPEKVVALPAKVNGESVEHGGSGAFTMGKRCGINEGIVRCAAALDAAGVKWVEGE